MVEALQEPTQAVMAVQAVLVVAVAVVAARLPAQAVKVLLAVAAGRESRLGKE